MTSTSPEVRRRELVGCVAAVLQELTATPATEVAESTRLFVDLGLDSLTIVEVVVACERRCGVSIADDAIESLRTVGDVVDLLARTAARASLRDGR